jgi:predicted Zn-ribbon and HTH transcriptional regulator
MAKVQIRYKDRTQSIIIPNSLDQLKTTVKQIFRINKPKFQYFDEDSELITVDVQLELNEAIRFITENNTYLIVEEETLAGSVLQFIDDLPLMKSQITSDETSKFIEESVVLKAYDFNFKNPSSDKNDFQVFAPTKGGEIKFPDFSHKTEEKPEENGFSDIEHLKFSGLNEESNPLEETKKPEPAVYDDILYKDIHQSININPSIIKPDAYAKNPPQVEDTKKNLNTTSYESFPEISLIKEDPLELEIDEIREVIQQEIKKSVIFNRVIHDSKCSKCGAKPIIGVMYKCKYCIGFNLCEACEDSINHPHSLLKIKKPIKQSRLEELLGKICEELSFKDKEKVTQAIIANDYDYNKTVSALLLQ